MSAVCFHFTTSATSNTAIQVRAGQTANLKGLSIVGAATATYFKFYWYPPTAAAQGPTVGTTVPNLTIGMAASANILESWPDGITGNGQLWIAATGAAVDSDASAPAAGTVVTLTVE